MLFRKYLKGFLVLLFPFLLFFSAYAENVNTLNPKVKTIILDKNVLSLVEKERSQFTQLLKSNPNYFGTSPKSAINPAVALSYNVKYEELMAIGFYPESDLLEGFIQINLPAGYKSGLCQNGSYEYVRFFADWEGNGIFEDLGVSQVNVHDIPNASATCLDTFKPLTYTVFLNIQSPKKGCDKPNLVKIRAILSWENIPEENNPNFIPVWGNIVEDTIQIKPVQILKPELLKGLEDVAKFDIYNKQYFIDLPEQSKQTLQPKELQFLYNDQKISDLRYNFPAIYEKAKPLLESPLLKKQELQISAAKNQLIQIHPDLPKLVNVQYEELNLAGLNYDLDMLTAVLTVKSSYGYSGGLCTKGSNEYVGFWLYVWEPKLKKCSWRYMGTASVNVHDIPAIPENGLKYAVKLPADLSWLKKPCDSPVVLKVRAILSWQTPPPTDKPFYLPYWGNRVDTLIQPKPQAVASTKPVPFISVVGGMAVENISGNPQTVVPSGIGDGYANGPAVYGGYTALESPFGGTIAICGHIANPPNDPPADANKLQYKVQYRKVSSSNWSDLQNAFTIWISTWDGTAWSMSHKTQAPVNGYYRYEEDLTPLVQRFVEGNVLAQWVTPVAEGDGLYEIRVLVADAGAPAVLGVPAGHRVSNVVRIMVDNTRPTATISLDAGPCTKYFVNDLNPINGHFTALDQHIWKYGMSLAPYNNPPTVTPNYAIYPLLVPPGVSDSFQINTANTPSCGYVVYLEVRDRTIVNNHFSGNYSSASVGFCLLDN